MLINSELIEPKHVAKRENNFFVCNFLVTKPMFDKMLFPLQFGIVLLRISPVRKDHVIKFARAICLMCLIDSKENTAQRQEKQQLPPFPHKFIHFLKTPLWPCVKAVKTLERVPHVTSRLEGAG